MVRHATSHGFSVLMCTIVSAFLVEVIRPNFPVIINSFERFSGYIVNLFSLPFTVREFNTVLVASILAMIWGAFFKLQTKKYYTN